VARGIDNRAVAKRRTRKSIGAERTFFENLTDEDEIRDRLRAIAENVAERMKRSNASARTITVKIRDADFVTVTRSHTTQGALASASVLLSAAERLVFNHPPSKPIRLLGISVSSLQFGDRPGAQLDLDLPTTDEF
jgi:DNA polymerase-4